jgi:hypothetical protein
MNGRNLSLNGYFLMKNQKNKENRLNKRVDQATYFVVFNSLDHKIEFYLLSYKV